MIKNTVINAELGYALATARHKDAIVICDANMPIPDGCNVIDVSLIRGVPTLEQTMCAISTMYRKNSAFVQDAQSPFLLRHLPKSTLFCVLSSILHHNVTTEAT